MNFLLAFLVVCSVVSAVISATPAEAQKQRCENRNEVYLPCGEAKSCETTCGELYNTCTRRFIKCPEGCQCKEGFARDPRSKNCVRINTCPDHKKCPRNMNWLACGNACTDTCNKETKRCTADCKEGCFCTGDWRRSNDTCIRKERC